MEYVKHCSLFGQYIQTYEQCFVRQLRADGMLWVAAARLGMLWDAWHSPGTAQAQPSTAQAQPRHSQAQPKYMKTQIQKNAIVSSFNHRARRKGKNASGVTQASTRDVPPTVPGAGVGKNSTYTTASVAGVGKHFTYTTAPGVGVLPTLPPPWLV